MDNKIQLLAEKLYKEGLEKGNQEAQSIIEKAKAEEVKIISTAQAEAERLVEEAKKQAAELKKNSEAELRLFANQAVEALKSDVANLINDKIVKEAVNKATDDKAFMQQLILSLATEWVKREAVIIEVESAEAQKLKAFFAEKAKSLLDGKVEIKEVNGRGASFVIAPADGSYRVSFGAEEFVAFFKEYLRPQLVEMLF